MFVLSQISWEILLGRKNKIGKFLDVGAGDGGCTIEAAPLFDEVVATEASRPLAWRLWKRGFETVRTMSLTDSGLCNGTFDVVACFNVLDRCDDPYLLLRELRQCIKPDGLIVLAVVMPYYSIVDVGTLGAKQAKNALIGIPGRSDKAPNRFERCVNAMVETVFEKSGFELVSVSRVPYLSHGDNRKGLY